MGIPTPYRDYKERIISEAIMRIAEIMGRGEDFRQYSTYAQNMKKSHPKDYARVKVEIMEESPAWIREIMAPLNDLYNEGYRIGFAESAKVYGKKDEAVKKMRHWPQANDD